MSILAFTAARSLTDCVGRFRVSSAQRAGAAVRPSQGDCDTFLLVTECGATEDSAFRNAGRTCSADCTCNQAELELCACAETGDPNCPFECSCDCHCFD